VMQDENNREPAEAQKADRRWDEGDFTFVKSILGQISTLTGHSPGGTKALRQSVRFKRRR